VAGGEPTAEDAELFRAQMLTEMARMSLEDGSCCRFHPGSFRNHNPHLFERFGRDMGADIPTQTEYVRAPQTAARPVRQRAGLTVILFMLDETASRANSRRWPALSGPHARAALVVLSDSPEGMRRFRELATETAGFYNAVGFHRRHARVSPPFRRATTSPGGSTAPFWQNSVVTTRLDEDEAHEVAHDLAYRLAKKAYKL
jgi:glucuronate isomerase